MTGFVRYVGVSGVGRRRVRRFDERVVPTRGAGSLRHDAEVRETVVTSEERVQAKNGFQRQMGLTV